MKLAILSDIHSNFDAFVEVAKAIEAEKPDKIVLLGDIVGYGAEPSKCIKLAKELTQNIVAGNHDYGVANLTSVENFNIHARTAIEWTRKSISDSELAFLAHLPLTLKMDGFLFIHSSPGAPAEWNYILEPFDANLQFRFFEEPILFLGHTHIPIIWVYASSPIEITNGKQVQLNKNKRYIINVGSVGQPRDGNPRSSFGIFDSENWTFTLHRVMYDIESASRKIKGAGLPLYLAERIKEGF